MIPLAIPNISGNEAAYLLECIQTNFVSSIGPFVTRLQQLTTEATAAEACVAVSSGTAGLHTALMAVGVGPGDLVLLPSFTFIASANAVSHCNATPWFVDIAKDSWCMNPDELAMLLRKETQQDGEKLVHITNGQRVAAIMPVYTLGTPADMDPIIQVAKEFNLPIIADAAAALGARYKGRNLSELADLSVFSFNGNKTVTAGGGGAIVGNNLAILGKAHHLTTTARVGDGYEHDAIGYNYRMTNLQAAVGCAQIERLDNFVAIKRRIRARYDEAFKMIRGIQLFPQPIWAESACWFSGLVLEDPSLPSAKELCAELFRREIGSRAFWKPMHLQLPYLDAQRSSLTITESIWDKIVTLPCSTGLTDEEQERVIKTLESILT